MKNRRDFLKLSGIAGAVALLPWKKINADDQGGCVLTPTEVEGPYPYPTGEINNPLNIIDIRGGQPGAQLDLIFTVVDIGACIPLPNVRVDIWHCNASGDYSGYGSFVGQDFLRGYQFTDANGIAQFTTIYPGWYPGRATHIHMEIYFNNVLKKIAQLAFDDTFSNGVHASAPYPGNNTTPTLNDGIFNNSLTDLANETAIVTGPNAGVYTGTYTIGLSGIVGMEKHDSNLSNIRVYPNPAADRMIITHPSAAADAIVKIYNAQGKLVAEERLREGGVSTSIVVNHLAGGMYNLVAEKDGIQHQLKFMKR